MPLDEKISGSMDGSYIRPGKVLMIAALIYQKNIQAGQAFSGICSTFLAENKSQILTVVSAISFRVYGILILMRILFVADGRSPTALNWLQILDRDGL